LEVSHTFIISNLAQEVNRESKISQISFPLDSRKKSQRPWSEGLTRRIGSAHNGDMSHRTWNADLPGLSPEMAKSMREQRARIRASRAAARAEVTAYRKARAEKESK
jgi:hypothetical protein